MDVVDVIVVRRLGTVTRRPVISQQRVIVKQLLCGSKVYVIIDGLQYFA